jgi:DnaJ-class molecular chaperone
MDKCTSCNGDGWHYAGDGMMYECHPCNTTGIVQTNSKVLSEESFGKVKEAVKEPANPFLALRKLMRRKRG